MRHKARLLSWRTGSLTASVAALSLVLSGTALATEPPGYVANQAGATATVLDTATNATTPLTLPATTNTVTVSPDGTTAYFASYAGNALYEVDAASLTLTGTVPLGAGNAPFADGHAVAVTPGGAQVLVAGYSGTLTVINAASGTVAASVPLGGELRSVAVTPDGAEALLADVLNNRIYIVNLATDQLTATIPVANDPMSIQVTPDGSRAYIAYYTPSLPSSPAVSVLNLDTNAVTTVATRSALGGGATSVAISPDGTTAYIAAGNGTLAAVDTASNTVTRQVAAPGSVGPFPNVAVTPSGSTVYLAAGAFGASAVYPFDTAAGTFGATIPASTGTGDIMTSPDQAPVAALSVTPDAAGSASSFDASASTVKYGTIASYHWDFGDGDSATTGTPTTSHVYADAGDYTVTLTETSSNGTSTAKVFTGQTMLRNGGPSARTTASLTVPAAGHPAVSIAKTASVPSFAAAGTAITYTYTVTNEGSVPLHDVTVTDSRLADVCGAPFSLAASESRPCTVDYITTAADEAAGQIANTVTVDGDAADGQAAHDAAALSIPLAERPAVSVAKTASVPSFAATGTAITYTYTVTNNGNVPLQDIAVTDTRLEAVACPVTALAVGQAVTCAGAYHSTAADQQAGQDTNSATVTAVTADGLAVTGHASLAIPLQVHPAISIDKNSSATSFTAAGQAVTYTFRVTDNGNVPLHGVKVTDTQAGPVSCPAATLAVGEAMACTAAYRTTAADVTGGEAADTATVTAADPAGLRLTGQESLVIPLAAVRLPQVPVTG